MQGRLGEGVGCPATTLHCGYVKAHAMKLVALWHEADRALSTSGTWLMDCADGFCSHRHARTHPASPTHVQPHACHG